MKNVFIAILLVVGLQCYSQQKSETTEEEYNYLTKGYALDLKTGHDIKAGYELEKFYSKVMNEYSFTYYFFNETTSGKTKAVLIIAKKEKGSDDKIFYICLPFNNNDLMKKALKDRVSGIMMSELFEQANYMLLSKSLNLLKNNPTGKFIE